MCSKFYMLCYLQILGKYGLMELQLFCSCFCQFSIYILRVVYSPLGKFTRITNENEELCQRNGKNTEKEEKQFEIYFFYIIALLDASISNYNRRLVKKKIAVKEQSIKILSYRRVLTYSHVPHVVISKLVRKSCTILHRKIQLHKWVRDRYLAYQPHGTEFCVTT